MTVDPHTTSPVTPRPPWITSELIERTIAVWQPRFGKAMTEGDAVALLIRVGALMDVLDPLATRATTDARQIRRD